MLGLGFTATRVEGAVEPHEAFSLYMGINLCCGEVCVAQHVLNDTQVRAVLQKVCGKGMAQDVGEDMLLYAGLCCAGANNLPNALSCKGGSAIRKEEMRHAAVGVL